MAMQPLCLVRTFTRRFTPVGHVGYWQRTPHPPGAPYGT